MADKDAARISEINQRRREGNLTAADYLDALQQVRDNDYWHRWAMRALLVLGAAHFLAGIVFFFAYNWTELSQFSKFALVQSGLIACFVAALMLRLDSAAGQGMLIAASIFTGVLLAVIGQVYQTGADAWELFAGWSALILLWVVASQNAAHWMLWIVIAMTAAGLYCKQVLIPLGVLDPKESAVVVGLLPALALAAREFAIRLGQDYLDADWMRRSLVLFSLGWLFLPAVYRLFSDEGSPLSFFSFILVAAAVSYAYFKLLPDFSILAICTGFLSLMGMAIGARLIFEMLSINDTGGIVVGLLLLGILCAAVTTAAIRLLKYLHKTLPGEHAEESANE